MGQAIVYCSNCSSQLRGADFESRRAFKVDDLNFCLKCYREVRGAEPPPPVRPPPPAPASSSRPSHGTARIAIVHPPPAPRSSNGTLLVTGAVGGIGAVILVLAIAFSGSGDERRSSGTVPPALSRPPPESSRVSSAEAAAQEAFARALRTEDLAARKALLLEAVARCAGTSLEGEPQRELSRVERQLQARAAPVPAALTVPVPAVAAAPSPEPIPAPAVAPAPKAPERTREEEARRVLWEAALLPATGRDYPAAIAALEKAGNSAEDVALLRSVAAFHQEAIQSLSRTSKGQRVSIEFRDESGAAKKAEAAFVELENGRLELRSDSGPVEIETGEILPSSLAELLRARKGMVDAGTAALFCLLEGDDGGARRLVGDKTAGIPDRYWTYARNVAPGRDPGRTLYLEARTLAQSFATAADAVPKYQALLRDHADSSFVRRNRSFLAAQAQQCGRDFLFVAADLRASGAFKVSKNAKGTPCWTSEADSDAAKRETYLELSYSVVPDTAYKCWIFAGACCQETFECAAQGTEMKSGKDRESAEPGSAVAAAIKPWLSTLKKTHASHGGPKQPTHWEWVEVPLPKYAKPGLQVLRVLTSQKGFSVAYACVTATRPGAPKELDFRDLEKSRIVPGAPASPRATVLFAFTLDGQDRHLIGELREKALYGVTAFQSCFAGRDAAEPAFTMPAQGELHLTYFLKSVTPMTVRVRVIRGADHSDAYDTKIVSPQAGRPVELRIPFSEFKPATPPQPPLAPGDVVNMIHIYGQDVACGLRLEALSVVDLGGGRSVVPSASKLIFSESFENGAGRFGGGDVVDGGVRGSKALSVPPTGVSVFGAWSVPIKESVTISFKLKPLADLDRVEILVWSDALKDNGRYFIEGLRKGEWKEVRFKTTELRQGWSRDGAGIDTCTNIRILFPRAPADTRVLLNDFEIRE